MEMTCEFRRVPGDITIRCAALSSALKNTF